MSIKRILGKTVNFVSTVALKGAALAAGTFVGSYVYEADPLNINDEFGAPVVAAATTAVTTIATDAVLTCTKNCIVGNVKKAQLKKQAEQFAKQFDECED